LVFDHSLNNLHKVFGRKKKKGRPGIIPTPTLICRNLSFVTRPSFVWAVGASRDLLLHGVDIHILCLSRVHGHYPREGNDLCGVDIHILFLPRAIGRPWPARDVRIRLPAPRHWPLPFGQSPCIRLNRPDSIDNITILYSILPEYFTHMQLL